MIDVEIKKIIPAIETSDGTSANVGSAIGGIGYKLGWYF